MLTIRLEDKRFPLGFLGTLELLVDVFGNGQTLILVDPVRVHGTAVDNGNLKQVKIAKTQKLQYYKNQFPIHLFQHVLANSVRMQFKVSLIRLQFLPDSLGVVESFNREEYLAIITRQTGGLELKRKYIGSEKR